MHLAPGSIDTDPSTYCLIPARQVLLGTCQNKMQWVNGKTAVNPFRSTICTGAGHSRQEQWPVLLMVAVAALPGFIIKQMINVAQIGAASSSLIILDQNRDREKKRRSQ